MKNNVTELVFILDKSGSMFPLVNDTLGGFNSMLEKQKSQPGRVYVTTVLFNTEICRIHDRIPLADVPHMTENEYVPGGCTALLDAIGSTVEHIETIHKYARPEDVPENTMFVIITDGMENASHRFRGHEIKSMLQKKQKENGWEFIFLGANIDALDEAESIGISRAKAANFHADDRGMTKVFDAVSCAVSSARCAGPIDSAWKAGVDDDFKSRKKNR